MKKLSLHQLINSKLVQPKDVHNTIHNLSQMIIQQNNLKDTILFNGKRDMLGSVMLFINDNYTFDIVKGQFATHILCNPK